jgi:hypothetical protein
MTTTHLAFAMPAPVGRRPLERERNSLGSSKDHDRALRTVAMAADATTALSGAPVRIDNLSKHFGRRRGRVMALDDVSLDFPAGSFTAVLGASGSGKTTLLQCAAGLERPSSGRVTLCGTDPASLSDRKRTGRGEPDRGRNRGAWRPARLPCDRLPARRDTVPGHGQRHLRPGAAPRQPPHRPPPGTPASRPATTRSWSPAPAPRASSADRRPSWHHDRITAALRRSGPRQRIAKQLQ